MRISTRPERVVVTSLLVVLTATLALGVIYSLELRIGFDTAWMMYVGRLIDQHGIVPYRDYFERNFPGALYTYVLIGKITGYTDDRAFRLVDLSVLAAISAVTWAWLKPLGKHVAWAAIVLFGLAYIGADTSVIGQREYFIILPLVTAAMITVRARHWPAWLRAGLSGLLVGLASTIKPHAVIGLAAIVPLMLRDELKQSPKQYFKVALNVLFPAAVGAAIPNIAEAIYLIANGADRAFIDALNFSRLYYSRVGKDLSVIEGPERTWYAITSVLGLNGMLMWLIPAGLGLAFFLYRKPHAGIDQPPGDEPSARRRWHVWQIVTLAACYAIYPAISGQFFDYHWLICLFFLMALAALAFGNVPDSLPRWAAWLPSLAIIAALLFPPDWTPRLIARMGDRWVAGNPIPTVDGGVSIESGAFLRAHLKPGEKVQALGSGGAPLHGMLLADALPATWWLVDTPLHHDVSTPTVSAMRRDFARELDESHARFVIDLVQRSFIHGADTDESLPETSAVLGNHYEIAYVGHGFSIYEREPELKRGIVVYPLKPRDVPILFHPTAAEDVYALGLNRAQNLDQKALGDFVSGYDVIQAEFLDGGTGPDQNIDRALAGQAFRIEEYYLAGTRVVEYLVGDSACLSTEPQVVTFGGSIQLDRTVVALVERGSSRWACVRLEWSARAAIPESYKISLRLIGPNGDIIAQSDHVPAGNTVPTSTWAVGQTVIDQTALPIPPDAPNGAYHVQMVIYNEATGQNLPATGPGADDILVTVGEVDIR